LIMANNKPIGVAYADPQLDSFQVGTSNAPIEINTSGVLNGAYATTSATSGDTRLNFNRLTFTSTGSGETARFLTRVTGANGATGGTINGAHISTAVNTGGTISGAANAIRATIGGTSTNPGGTLAALQLDSDFASGGTWSNASFLRVTNSGTGEVGNFALMPAVSATGVFRAKVGSPVVTHTIPVVSGGTTYYIMVSTVA
jgi:hypothetical protein